VPERHHEEVEPLDGS